MKKAIKISIPEPCHEDWAKMTPTEKGKFCNVCTKEVFDFTETSDEELVKRVTQGKNLCGRFKKSQLDREVKLERKSSNSILPYAASLLMPLSMMASEVKNNSEIEKPFISLGIGSHPIKSIIYVSGYVTDADGNPVRNAEVVMLEKGDWVRTDAQGFYSLKCVSGSTLFVKKGDLRSQDYTLGTKNERVDFSLIPEVKTTIVTVGKIASVEITQGEIEEIVISEIEEVEEEILEEKQNSSKVVIKGTVTDEMNMPLPGANVIVKGTANGTQTDFDGNYEIELEANQTISFSYLGYDTKEITVSNISNTIDVKMDAYYLGGLVGYVIVSEVSEQVVVDPYQSNSYYDEEQRENREKRRAYAEKENAFKKVKADRKKAARLLKRSQKKDK
ncbi:carboxypeptidase-like regulatory domain-containing protein [Halomarinibacterium sedimenti]|nr:carboxypeptidase-like regulatory domain-containing protein [Halomarinibacterium sedimenti]